MNQSDDLTPAQRVATAAAANAAAIASEPEQQLWAGGYSPRAMLGTWVTCTLLTLGGFVAMIILPSQLGADIDQRTLWGIGLGLILLLWAIAVCIYFYRRISVHYELTTQRLIHKHGILIRTSDRIELIDINDIAYTQGIFERMFNVGGIKISSNDRSHPELKLIGIQDVSKVSGMIDDARRKERRKRALHMA